MTVSRTLARLADQLESVEREFERTRMLGARRRLSALRSASDEELRRLRDLLAVDPLAAEQLLSELASRSGAGASDLHSALSAELRKRDPRASSSATRWDSMSRAELHECVALMRRGVVEADGSLRVSAAAERTILRCERRAELRGLLGLEPRDCLAGAEGCDCLGRALDRFDATPALRALGKRGVLLVARRAHRGVRRRRASGAERRRRRRGELLLAEVPAEVEDVGEVEDSPELDADDEVAESVRDDHRDDAGEHDGPGPLVHADRRPRRSTFSGIAGARSLAFSRASDAELLGDLFAIPYENVVDAGRVPAGSAFNVTRRPR